MSRRIGPVPYGNCKIRDNIGATKIIISTDYVEGKSEEEINRRYMTIQDIYGAIESGHAIGEARRNTREARSSC